MVFSMFINTELSSAIDIYQTDKSAGINRIRLLAETGNNSAILCLGLYLSEDKDTTDEAIHWLTIADSFESADAAWNLAMISRERNDISGMKKWVDRAAALGESDAIEAKRLGYDVSSVLKAYD